MSKLFERTSTKGSNNIKNNRREKTKTIYLPDEHGVSEQ